MESDQAKVTRMLGERLIRADQLRTQIELLRTEIFWQEIRAQGIACLACCALLGLILGVYLANH